MELVDGAVAIRAHEVVVLEEDFAEMEAARVRAVRAIGIRAGIDAVKPAEQHVHARGEQHGAGR